VGAVELIETHVSWILLTGEYAYKIKRPVQHSFVDQRALERRGFLCHEEVRLNRRFAPELYLGVCPIAVHAGEAQVGGPGPVIEYAVKMRQFFSSEELDQLLQTTRLEPTELDAFGHDLAQIHARLPVARPTEDMGHPNALVTLIIGNVEECVRAGKALGWTFDLHPMSATLEALLVSTARTRSERLTNGRIRECHGDLHARNIVRHGSRLIAFDCLEFDPGLRWIDVADEIAFLLVDLDVRQRPLHAQAFLNGYLTESGDYQACALQPLFQAHRALVRAKITALSAAQADISGADTNAARSQYEAYLDGARRAVAPKRPILVLMCGLSGSGKTWLAQRLAPALAAVHLRSDIERKRLAGLAAIDRSESPVGEGLYSREASQRVYSRLAECAADTLRGGYTTIVDATFGRAEDRSRFRDLASPLGVRTCVVYCHAPRQVLEARIVERQRRQHDASEADLGVLAWQEGHFEAPELHEVFAVLAAQSPEPAVIESLIQRIAALGASEGRNSPGLR
jgi:aminoglycoside phosphotransferase family enzyme/predicted kinase